MKTLTQICLSALILLVLPLFLVLRVFGWRPDEQKRLKSTLLPDPGGHALVRAEKREAHPYPYVYIDKDGSARELDEDERNYLETPFFGADGARPYVKWRYRQKNGWGELAGFLKRTKLPRRVSVAPAPMNQPKRDASTETIRRAREMGCDVIQHGNGSYTILPSKMFRSDL